MPAQWYYEKAFTADGKIIDLRLVFVIVIYAWIQNRSL